MFSSEPDGRLAVSIGLESIVEGNASPGSVEDLG